MLPSPSGILAKAISTYEITVWTENSDFMDQICPKKEIQVKYRKNEHLH